MIAYLTLKPSFITFTDMYRVGLMKYILNHICIPLSFNIVMNCIRSSVIKFQTKNTINNENYNIFINVKCGVNFNSKSMILTEEISKCCFCLHFVISKLVKLSQN
jgi:hypothetical protein